MEDTAFMVICTKSRDSRFIKGNLYNVRKDGRIVDEHGHGGCTTTTKSFEAWYADCSWTDYDFALTSANAETAETLLFKGFISYKNYLKMRSD